MVRFNKKGSQKAAKYHIGEIRKSQLISTFGIGSIVDFVKDTTIIGGVDDWDKGDDAEYRHLTNENLQALTGAEYFIEPKTSSGSLYSQKNQDIVSYPFPEKLYCPVCKSIIDYRELSAQKDKLYCNQIINNKHCKSKLVASRFILVCENGHTEDFPYSWWVHKGENCSSGKKSPRIAMYNIGNRSDTESLIVECRDCGCKRSMVGVFSKNALFGENGYCCSGKHPHLGSDFHDDCSLHPTVRLRTSSSVYFPVNYSALLIPPWSQKALHYIEKNYTALSFIEDESKKIEYIQKAIMPKCTNLTLEDFIGSYNILKIRREKGIGRTESDIYEDEYKILCRDNVNEDRYSSHFVVVPKDFNNYFESVSVVDRLVVTMALKGFTRLRPYNGIEHDRIAPLSREKKEWLPAIELNGEGIFVKFNNEAIERWKKNIGERYYELNKSHNNSFLSSPKYSDKYIMLHTFAHLFIRQLSNECGYSAASMKEKIYSDFIDDTNNTQMNGVLIYLSSSDSDGSLGGLISIAEDTELLDKVLKDMLREARWCSGDPLCSSSMHQGFASLNYAACHACTLIPETSCEFRNVLLDRVSVVGKPENPILGILGELSNKV